MKRVFAFVGFSMAITLVLLNLLDAKYCLCVLIGLAAVFVASLVIPKYRQAKVVPLSFGAALFACLLFCLNYNSAVAPQLELANKSFSTRLYVTSYPEINKDNYIYSAKIEQIDEIGKVHNINVLLYSDSYFEPYTQLDGTVKLYASGENPYASYGAFADKHYLKAYSQNLEPTGVTKKSILKSIKHLRNDISIKLNSIIGDDEGAISAAIVTGDKSNISHQVKNWFSYSGTSHIMAVSGLHLSVVIGAFLLLCRLIKLKDRLACLLSIMLAIIYIALADFSGSIVRAGIMILVLMLGKILNKRSDTLNSLGIASSIMCLNPYAVTDIGILYSVLAVLALVTLYPKLSKKFKVSYIDPLDKQPKEKIRDAIGKIASVLISSCCILLFDLPVSFIFFGYCSVASPVANIAVMLLGAPCVIASILTYIVSLIGFGPATIFVASIAKYLDMALIANAKLFSSFRGSTVYLDKNFGVVLCGVLMIVAYGFFTKNRKTIKTCFALGLCVLVLGTTFTNIIINRASTVFVTTDGAVVAKQNGKVIVAGVKSYDDYYYVKEQLNLFNDKIDILVVPDEYLYSMMLCDNADVNMILTDYFDEGILSNTNYNSIEVQDYYNISLEESFALCYNQGSITIKMNDFSISNFDMNCNAYIYDDAIYDQNGIIKLSDGNVVYTVGNQNTYKARRINQWQK